MLKKRIKKRALSAMVAAIVMSLALVIVAGIGLNKTGNIITEFESKSLPDIRVALELAEGVAQLTALAPYVSSTNQPSLLSQQQDRLQQGFEKLFQIAKIISDDELKRNLSERLTAIQSSSDQLINVVAENIFLSEELLSRRYQLMFSKGAAGGSDLSDHYLELVDIDSLMTLLLDPTAYQIKHIDSYINALQEKQQPVLVDFLTFAKANSQSRISNEQRKRFLLVSMRVQAEYLSNYVNLFANTIQQQVLAQQLKAQRLINQVFWSMVAMMALLIITVITNYGNNLRVLNDLTSVTDDMIRLSNGDSSKGTVFEQRKDEVGELFNAYLIFQDYTLQIQRVSQDLAQQKLLLETIFDSMNDGLSVFSSENRLLAWNKKYLKLFALSEHQLYTQMPLEEVIQLLSCNGEVFKDVTGNIINIREWTAQRHTDAQYFDRFDNDGGTIEFRSQPMPTGGFITLIQDLTYRRQTELQLQHAKKMEVIGQLTGGVSHDFNNFLTSILGNLQLLEMCAQLDEKNSRYLERALKATEKGSALVKKLLAFSHKKILEPEAVLLDELITDIADLLQYSVSDNVQFDFQLACINQAIKIDKIQLQNALLNLTLNANGAITENGHICISTELLNKDNKDWLRVSVTDNGIGIPYAIQHRVFEAFFTTKEIGAGTGLGLSSVHAYVQQSGGEIGIESTPNVGTTVWMQWPVENSAQIVARTEQKPGSEIIAQDSQQGVLLLVEDDQQVAATMQDFLRVKFKNIKHFSRADSAWEWLQQHSTELLGILSDVHLGNSISGIELKEKVNHHYPDLHFFVYSGMPKEMIEEQFACKIENNFINKPVTYEDIASIASSNESWVNQKVNHAKNS